MAVYLESLSVVIALLALADHNTVFPQGTLIFWVFATPLTGWAIWMGSYGAAAVMVFRVLMVVDPFVSAIALVIAVRTRAPGTDLFGVAFGATIVMGIVARAAYRRSVLRRVGAMR